MKNARNAAVRRLETALLTAAVLMMSAATATGATTRSRSITGTCATHDARSDRLVAQFKDFVGKTDMGGKIEKTTMGLTNVTPSQVVLVTDKATCTKAAAAFDSKQLQKRSSYKLYVVNLGSSYGVEDTVVSQAGFETADIFDSNWKYIGVRQIHS